MKFALVMTLSLCVSTTAFSALPCGEAFDDASSPKNYQAHEITRESLEKLLGATISYSGKYNYLDPTDNRTISGKGIVLSAELWSQDKKPSFSLKLQVGPKDIRSIQTFLKDPSFLLQEIKPSELPTRFALAKQNGLEIKQARFLINETSEVAFYRDPAHQKLKIMIIRQSESSFRIEEIHSTATKVPSDQEIAMNFINQQPLELEFQTTQGIIKLRLNEIIAVAY